MKPGKLFRTIGFSKTSSIIRNYVENQGKKSDDQMKISGFE